MSRANKKITPDYLKTLIKDVIYEDREIGGHRVVHCHIVLHSGFIVYGTYGSTSVDPAMFNSEMAKQLSYDDTFKKLYQLEAYHVLAASKALEASELRIPVDVMGYVTHHSSGYSPGPIPHHETRYSIVHLGEVHSFTIKGDDLFVKENQVAYEQARQFLLARLPIAKLYSDKITGIARVCHEANRAFCESVGDHSQESWEQTPDWQRKIVCEGVVFHLTGDHSPSASHENWMALKEADGWVWGDEKDAKLKTHPCMVPYDQIPTEQKSKDFIFRSIIHSFKF